MLNLFQSNNMHELIDAFVARMPARSDDPFVARTVLAESHGTGQWLKLQVAGRVGISANIRTLLPAHFIWQLYNSLLDIEGDPATSLDTLAFQWLALLESGEAPPTRLAEYLAGPGDAGLRRFQLAAELALLFDSYLIYRPDWLNAWQRGEDPIHENPEPWQPLLWRRLLDRYPVYARNHRAALHEKLQRRLKKPVAALSQGISVFGVTSLPPMHMQTLQALARHTDVDVYFLNPSEHYWGDIAAERDLFKRSVAELLGKSSPLSEEDYFEVGHPLLASFGKQGREYFEMLFDVNEIQVHDRFEPPEAESNLAHLQRNVLALTNETSDAGVDGSIEFHSCHSKVRELEVLLDRLLLLFANTDIRAEDIIVMSPGINEYAPFINTVFAGKIETFIADRSPLQQSSLIDAFLSLLALPSARMTSVEVMDILETPAVARRFGFSEEDLARITTWVTDTGIRWEMDGESRAARWQLPNDDRNTWQFGLERLLLGVMVDEGSGAHEGRLARNVASGDLKLLEGLIEFVDRISRTRDQLSRARNAADWQKVLTEIIEALYEARGDEHVDLDTLQVTITRLPALTEAAGYEGELSAALVRHWLERQLGESRGGATFLSRGITFATLVPMRSIPFRVVCLLGMNDTEFPRNQPVREFDLLGREPRKGDRSRRTDDRYLFLEALLAARDKLIITYEGRARRDNARRPPSVVVSELMTYCNDTFGGCHETEHPLQPFSPRYYAEDGPPTFEADWYAALTSPVLVPPWSGTHLAATGVTPDGTTLDALTRGLQNTAQHYLRTRMGVSFFSQDIVLKDTETFTHDDLEKYNLADQALAHLRRGGGKDAWFDNQMASGHVMANDLGRHQLEGLWARATSLHDTLVPLLRDTDLRRRRLEIDGLLIMGELPHVGVDHQVCFRSGRLSARHRLGYWLAHLFANAAIGDIRTHVVTRAAGSDAATGVFQPLSKPDAREHLGALASLTLTAAREPVCLPPETTWTWFNSLLKSGDPDDAMTRATPTWQGERFPENANEYWGRLFTLADVFDKQNLERAKAVWQPLIEHWEAL